MPLTSKMLREQPSGNIFGWTQNAGMGLPCSKLGQKEFLIVSNMGGVKRSDGKPIALGLHTGHWELGAVVKEAAEEFARLNALPFAAHCTDPCDGRSQGTPGMYESLAYRNDAAIVIRRLIRSLPTGKGVLGVSTCDKGLPAMMMAIAGAKELPGLIVPGGVTLPVRNSEDAGKVQTIGARYAGDLISLDEAAEAGCKACGSSGGGCQFLGTAATAQVVCEALGLSLPHSALAPASQNVWFDIARQSARCLVQQESENRAAKDLFTEQSFRNAMTVFLSFGGSTNLFLHIAAVAHAAGVKRPAINDWIELNKKVPRIVSVLPNGPVNHPTIFVYMAGGVPEVMLRLRELGLLELDCATATGEQLGTMLEYWEKSERRKVLKQMLHDREGVDPDDVIFALEKIDNLDVKGVVVFPSGNICPQGSVVKSSSIDPALIGNDGVYRKTGRARVFTTEEAAIKAIKEMGGAKKIEQNDIIVLICCGPLGAGFEEVYQITSALTHLPWGKTIAVITDARFSGVSTGACIGHISPEALAGGPIGKLQDNDLIEIIIDCKNLEGSLNIVGYNDKSIGLENGTALLNDRESRKDLEPANGLSEDTKLWALLQDVSGGVWGGSVYDYGSIKKNMR